MKEEGLLEGLREGREAGLQAGLQAGRQEGEHAAAVRILSRQLALRFGDSAVEGTKAILDTADPDQLLLWSERVLTAEVIEDVFA